ncbi:MAG: hypothetical protein JMN24_03980 [gamma proteobacterium endosymbiont of Lamellibrachia anaximandri]|nr:hypothetical protein [gamma proteobacterium endosymbiont of Lamellibrachia anaximandri]MBL3617931.1 hypothetical protein [gamma proteobacterium endosymbiont of Lamellibrachia anaximandri]
MILLRASLPFTPSGAAELLNPLLQISRFKRINPTASKSATAHLSVIFLGVALVLLQADQCHRVAWQLDAQAWVAWRWVAWADRVSLVVGSR